MLYLYITLGIILGLILILFIVGEVSHYLLFKKHYKPDPIVKGYTVRDFKISREAIEIKYEKGKLRGYSYNNDLREKDEIVIFCHGMFASIDSYNQEICTIAKAGYEVIAISYKGVADSDGKSMEGFGGSIKATKALIDYLEDNNEYKGRDIYLVGHSWGAYAVGALLNYNPLIKKGVIISGFTSLKRLFMGLLPKIAYPAIPFIIMSDYFRCHSASTRKTLDELNSFSGKVLIAHSENDPMVSYKLNIEYLKKNLKNKNVEFLINSDRAHNPIYTKEAVDYLNDYLVKCKTLKGDALKRYKREVDYLKMGELDMDMMNKLISFLNS